MPIEKKVKAVVIVSYHWPPHFYVGSVRPLKLAKYLPQYGWIPTVVTVKERYYDSVSTEKTDDLGDVAVVKSGCIPSPRDGYLSIKGQIFKWLGREKEFEEWRFIDRESRSEQRTLSVERPMARLKRYVASFLYTPDQYQGWIPFAAMEVFRLMRRRKVEGLVSIGPPFSAHLVGLVIKKLCGVWWVADFRDPWSINSQKPATARSVAGDALDRWMEASVMRHADRVVSVTPAMTHTYRRLYAGLPMDKWVTITNGFDPDDFRSLDAGSRPGKFTISYLGTFTYDRSPEVVLRALGNMVAAGEIERQAMAVRLIGGCRYALGRPVADLVVECGLEGVVEIMDSIPRWDALWEMARADVLVLLAPNQPLQVPAKTYEYLAAGGRILALTDTGATADVIRRVGGGAIISPGDHEGVRRILRTWYAEYRDGGGRAVGRPRSTIEEYEWSSLASAYARVLDGPT